MNEEDKTLMAKYGITGAPKMMYSCKQYRYENLADALNYAWIDHMHFDKKPQEPDRYTLSLVSNKCHARCRTACCPVSMQVIYIK